MVIRIGLKSPQTKPGAFGGSARTSKLSQDCPRAIIA
jgi:hypothetical protein